MTTSSPSQSPDTPTAASPSPALLQEAPLRELIAAKVVTGATAIGGHGGFVIEVCFGERTVVLANAKGEARLFAALTTVATYLQRLGFPRFEVDVADYHPGRIRPAQPERSAAMMAGRLPRATSKSKKRRAEKASA